MSSSSTLTLLVAIVAFAALQLCAGDSADSVQLANFTGDLKWQTVNDPVMGGESYSSISIDDSTGLWQGEVKIVPFLHAAGFCIVQTAGTQKFPDVSGHDAFLVRLSAASYAPYNQTGFQVQIKTTGGRHGLKHGYYTADFKAAADVSTVAVPFSAFELQWRGQPIPGPPLADQLDKVEQVGISVGQSPNLPGKFFVEIAWIGAGSTGGGGAGSTGGGGAGKLVAPGGSSAHWAARKMLHA